MFCRPLPCPIFRFFVLLIFFLEIRVNGVGEFFVQNLSSAVAIL